MVRTRQATTAEELARMPTGRGQRFELLNGELRAMAAAGFLHGQTVALATGLLWTVLQSRNLGILVGAETGFMLHRDPDHVRAPDVGFVAHEHLSGHSEIAGFLELAPDFAVEVVSPTDRWSDVTSKAQDWLDHGTRVVWIIDPGSRAVEIWRADGRIDRRRGNGEVDAEPVLPEFRCRVPELFPPRWVLETVVAS